jgi:phosphatidylserine/phosphatidylglycerophosphate/cardiolipin synthase-like enzyme
MSDNPAAPISSTRLARRRLPWIRWVLAALVLLYLITALWHLNKPLPPGLNADLGPRPVSDVDFLVDSTWMEPSGRQQQSTEIFEHMLDLIDGAERLIVLEVFLLNDFAGASGDGHRPLSSQVLQAMMARKRLRPEMPVILITDPFNRLYGGVESSALDAAAAAGVDIIETRLTALPDSNPVWSGFWRLCCQFLGNSTQGWLPNPVGGEPVSLRTYLRLLNFKANHRKALVVDEGAHWTGLVTSGNPHDASSRHSNVALEFSGPSALDLLATMQATAKISGFEGDWPVVEPLESHEAEGGRQARVLTESAIRDLILEILDSSDRGDRIDLALFYLSHRAIIESIEAAHARGVELRLLLDPNEDAFGRKKDGVPNRQVALELQRSGVPIRWCNTSGEQCHYKHMLQLDAETGRGRLLVGSANYTRRNLDGFNLETQVLIEADRTDPLMRRAGDFFDRRWNNEPERIHSLPYEAFEDRSRLRYWRYRFMEASGLSTF